MSYNDLAIVVIEGAINEVRDSKSPSDCQCWLVDTGYDWLNIMGYGINKKEWRDWVLNRCDKQIPLTFHRKS